MKYCKNYNEIYLSAEFYTQILEQCMYKKLYNLIYVWRFVTGEVEEIAEADDREFRVMYFSLRGTSQI